MKGINLANSSTANERSEKDFYPTPPLVTKALMDFINLSPENVIWEPACGDGAMSKVIESYGNTVISTDIRNDSGYGTGGVDFLTTEPVQCSAIITNPPFALSEQFIVKALEIAPLVCMVLKSQYWHAAGRTKLFVQHPPAYVMALNWRPDFLNGGRGGSPTMECLWTVWIRGQSDTRYRILQKPSDTYALGYAGGN